MQTQGQSDPIRVAVVGLGRSGYQVHIKALRQLSSKYRIVAVVDSWTERADTVAAELGAKSYHSLSHVLRDPEVELVTIAVPNHLHSSYTLDVIGSGKAAICDKPFGLSARDASEMELAAQTANVRLGAFYSRRYEATFRKVCEIIASGVLGEIVHVRMDWSTFARRWDWQTLREFGGGQLNNNFPHALDQGLCILEAAGFVNHRDFELHVDLRNTFGFGDAEDHVRVGFRERRTGMTMDIEMLSAQPYQADRWSVAGTRGGLRGDLATLEWKWLPESDLLHREVDRHSYPDRSYCAEELRWSTGAYEATDRFSEWQVAYYDDFHRYVRNGTPPPGSIRSACVTAEVLDRVRSAWDTERAHFGATS